MMDQPYIPPVTGESPAPEVATPHGPTVCVGKTCATCWGPGGLGLDDQGRCATKCAYGTCGGSPDWCGGCCRCLGGCIVQWENTQPDASLSTDSAHESSP